MKFKSFIGKQVMVGGKILTFTAEEYETECKDEIKSLQGAKGISEVVEAKSKRAKSQD